MNPLHILLHSCSFQSKTLFFSGQITFSKSHSSFLHYKQKTQVENEQKLNPRSLDPIFPNNDHQFKCLFLSDLNKLTNTKQKQKGIKTIKLLNRSNPDTNAITENHYWIIFFHSNCNKSHKISIIAINYEK